MIRAKRRPLLGLAAAACLAACPSSRAQDAVAVLSAASGSYLAAYDGFAKSFGAAHATFRLPERPATGSATRVVVAFGGAAALESYPERATLIVCLAPGLPLRSPHGGPFVLVDMKPPARTLLEKLRLLQPGLKRLAVLWNSEDTRNYLKELRPSASALGIELIEIEVKEPAEVPDVLRAQVGKADALWLAPDPRLVTPQTFQTVKQFSWDNRVPFYAPTAGLAAAGAAAAVSVSAQESGREAAELTRKALSGEPLPKIVYPADAELTINLESAAKAGLAITPAMSAAAARVIQ